MSAVFITEKEFEQSGLPLVHLHYLDDHAWKKQALMASVAHKANQKPFDVTVAAGADYLLFGFRDVFHQAAFDLNIFGHRRGRYTVDVALNPRKFDLNYRLHFESVVPRTLENSDILHRMERRGKSYRLEFNDNAGFYSFRQKENVVKIHDCITDRIARRVKPEAGTFLQLTPITAQV